MEVLIDSVLQEWQGFLQILPRIAMAVVVSALFVWIGKGAGRREKALSPI